ncbi:MAG: PucR family transcriptional regulator ligand-binding domain-containing protein [Oscillospiraceae bacterium]|jgi:sugar diacid utilization regulator|nr:PucR family transcriptional regulator ligand-binding domain-containing protein [Oscillospiraceae bacterium]
MSVTLSDLLKLPSLREASVLGGKRGLSKIVSSISVLESNDPSFLTDSIFPKHNLCGSEIVITGFLNAVNDIDLQCANIKRLAEGGEAGLILYYVGVYLPKVDPKLIRLADELDFALICMPRNRRDLRYSEVISDVMNCIFRDRMNSDSSVGDIPGRVACLPQHQRTAKTVLEMLSDQLSASLVLLDASGKILNLAAWPQSIASALKDGLARYRLPQTDQSPCNCPFIPNCKATCFPIRVGKNNMRLLILKENEPIREELLQQTLDVVQLSLNIWEERHEEFAIHALVQAILRDEPMKMRRLADLFRIDAASIHEMWILSSEQKTADSLFISQTEQIKSILKDTCKTVVADVYEDRLLLLMDSPRSLQEAETLEQTVLELLSAQDGSITLTRCANLQNTAEVRQAFLCCQSSLMDARKIYPNQKIYQLGEIQFAKQCRELIDQGDESVNRCLTVLNVLSDAASDDLMKTLEVFLLDGESSVTKTSELLCIHKNTVKYRTRRLSDLLGFRPDKTPENLGLYRAVAVHRLLS